MKKQVMQSGWRALLLAGGAFLLSITLTAQPRDGIREVTFDVPQKGKVRVLLPEDTPRGATISGTVIVEPAGKNDRQRARNQNKLSGYVIENKESREDLDARPGPFTWTIPAASTGLNLLFRHPNGRTMASSKAPVSPPVDIPPAAFEFPGLTQTGVPIRLRGPFDGDSRDTRLTFGGELLEVLVESPTGIVAQAPEDVVGPTDMVLTEGDLTVSETVRNVNVALSADQLQLRKGQRTTLYLQVEGLENLEQSVEIQLSNESPQQVDLAGGNEQALLITPGQVSGAGTFEQQYTLTGRQTGSFTVNAEVKGQDQDEDLDRCLRLAALAMGIPFEFEAGDLRMSLSLSAIYRKAMGEIVAFPAETWGIPDVYLDPGDPDEMTADALDRFAELVDECLDEEVNDGSDAAISALTEMALMGTESLGPVGQMAGGLARAIIAGNEIDENVCDLFRSLETLVNSNNRTVDEANAVLNAWAQLANIPQISSVSMPGANALIASLNRLDNASIARMRVAIRHFILRKCPR